MLQGYVLLSERLAGNVPEQRVRLLFLLLRGREKILRRGNGGNSLPGQFGLECHT